MGIEVLFEMFRDTRTPEQKSIEQKAAKRQERFFLAKAFLAVAGTIGIIGGGGYWLGSHSAHGSQNNCAAANSPALKP